MIDVYIDEMQSKFGENSIWVYEILRHVNAWLNLWPNIDSKLVLEGLIEMKVCS